MLSVLYLPNDNCRNAAHSIMALAVRTGIILGLHLEPPEHLPEQQREARKRLWWLIYIVEMNFAMELGRPLAVNISQVTCSLPSDEKITYTTVNKQTTLSKEAAYLSFSVHYIRLVLTTRAIYITFYDKCAGILGQTKQKSLYDVPQALEICAEYVSSRMQYS
jgi:predicted CDP-diglyceride synthetase/phosphatidate cytidylyltransferase